MRYIENFELREWVKDSLRKTIFQKAHALSIQTGCEILIKLRDDNDELTGQQCYATGSLQKAYLNNVLRKEPGEFFVSGETGQPLMDQGIQSDESPKTSSGQGTPVHPVSSPLAMSDSSVTETATQFTSIQAHDTSRKHSSSQVTDFHSSVDTIDYPDPDGAKDDPMEDDEPPGGNDDDDDIVTRIKIEPSDDLDNISALPPSGDDVSDTDMKTILDDIDDDVEQDTEDIEPSSPVSEGSGNQQESRHSIKPYQCSICSKSFRSIQVLQKHSQTMHRHGIVKSQGFKPKPSPTKRKLGGSTTRKHGGKVSATPQTLLHACSMCNQRFTESILLNDHIVKVHLNMDAINPPSAPFTQSQPPGTPEFGNVQGIPDPQMPQITSVSSLGTFPQTMNPAPSTATSSFSQSPMGPGPSTSDGSGSTQGTVQLVIDLENPELFQDVTVDCFSLSKAEVVALQKPKNQALALLNLVISLVFSKEELAVGQGIGLRPKGKEGKCLDRVKVAAIKEYVRRKCVDFNWQYPKETDINVRFQNKIASAKRELEKRNRNDSNKGS